MQSKLVGLAAGFVLIFSAGAAHAQFFSIAADVPLQYEFDSGESGEDVSGFKLAVNLPILIGFGFEDYTVTRKVAGSPNTELSFNLFDAFIDLPTPFINIGLGIGIGKADVVESGGATIYESASLFQYFVTLGIPFAAVFDIHVGYHQIQGSANNKSGGQDFKVDGNMVSLGLRFGF